MAFNRLVAGRCKAEMLAGEFVELRIPCRFFTVAGTALLSASAQVAVTTGDTGTKSATGSYSRRAYTCG